MSDLETRQSEYRKALHESLNALEKQFGLSLKAGFYSAQHGEQLQLTPRLEVVEIPGWEPPKPEPKTTAQRRTERKQRKANGTQVQAAGEALEHSDVQ